MPLSEETKQVLQFLIDRWREASAAERDSNEQRAFTRAITILDTAITQSEATHEGIRAAISVCPPYPNFGKKTLIELADAERDSRRVMITRRIDGAMKWEIEPVPAATDG